MSVRLGYVSAVVGQSQTSHDERFPGDNKFCCFRIMTRGRRGCWVVGVLEINERYTDQNEN